MTTPHPFNPHVRVDRPRPDITRDFIQKNLESTSRLGVFEEIHLVHAPSVLEAVIANDASGVRFRMNQPSDDFVFEWVSTVGALRPFVGQLPDLGTTGADWKDLWVRNIRNSNNALMIALAAGFPSPDSDTVHLWKGSGGAVTADNSSVLVLEDSGNTVMSLVSPNANLSGFFFAEPAGATRARLVYRGSAMAVADTWQLYTASVEQLRISAGAFAFQEATTISAIGNLAFGNSLLPATDRGQSLGSASLRWSGIHTDILRIHDFTTDPAVAGEFRQNATHVKVYSGGAVRNLSDISSDAKDQAVLVTHASAQTITSGASTVLNFDTEGFDTDAMHDTVTNNGRITFKTAGKYLVVATLRFVSNTTGYRAITVRENGSQIHRSILQDANQNTQTSVQAVTIGNFIVDDYVEAIALQTSGGNLDTIQGSDRTAFEAHRLS